jgi:murein DD-endopeptidase MepM/ murein hydrolase activator NlpD
MSPPRPWSRILVSAATVVLVGPLLGLVALPASAAADDVVPVGTWPLDPQPEVVAAFDPPESPWGPGHRGVDLLGGLGQAVGSALPGSVVFAGPLAGRGVVVVDHGPTRTTYEPLVPSVRVGDRVVAGAELGRLTAPASHCYPRLCLHWGWRRGETYLDPLALVGGGPVRLLPVWAAWPAGPLGGNSVIRLPGPYAGWRPAVDRRLAAGYLP